MIPAGGESAFTLLRSAVAVNLGAVMSDGDCPEAARANGSGWRRLEWRQSSGRLAERGGGGYCHQAMDWTRQRLYYNLCNPNVALDPKESRNVDLDHFGDQDRPVRGLNWLQELAASIEFSVADAAVEKPAFELFTGLPGSGKTTEILRLRDRLKDPDRAHLLPVYIDADQYLDLTDRIDVSDLRVVTVYEMARQVVAAEGGSEKDALKEGVLERLNRLLGGFSIGQPKVGLPGGTSLALEMKVQPGLRKEIRRLVAENTNTFLHDTDREMLVLKERAERCGYKGVVVLFDSLEKLRGTSERFTEVLTSAEQLFSAGAPYLQLPVHALYTIPPALIMRLRVPVHFMPMIKLWDQERTPFAPGLAAARAIIERRIPEGDVLRWCLGADTNEALEDRLSRLINWSAGYPREIIRLLRSAIRQGPLSDAGFARLLGQAGDDYRRLLLSTDLDWLASVALEHQLTPRDDQQRKAADRMLSNNVVLRYHNGSEWYDVHPAVREMPGFQQAVARAQAQKTQSLAPGASA